jgi:hypothetical protein
MTDPDVRPRRFVERDIRNVHSQITELTWGAVFNSAAIDEDFLDDRRRRMEELRAELARLDEAERLEPIPGS